MDRLTIPTYSPACEINHKPVCFEARVRVGVLHKLGAAEVCSNARLQLDCAERLSHIIVSAEIKQVRFFLI